MPKKSQNQTAADFIRRLPLHRQLDASQSMIIKLSPTWTSWAELSLSSDAMKHCQLNALQNGKLSLNCDNTTLASQIKHQKQRLLDHFHAQGFNEVQEIVIRMRPPNPTSLDQDKSDQKSPYIEASDSSLKAIENCSDMTNNEELSGALKRLSQVLKSEK